MPRRQRSRSKPARRQVRRPHRGTTRTRRNHHRLPLPPRRRQRQMRHGSVPLPSPPRQMRPRPRRRVVALSRRAPARRKPVVRGNRPSRPVRRDRPVRPKPAAVNVKPVQVPVPRPLPPRPPLVMLMPSVQAPVVYIEGPISLSWHRSQALGKTVYIFGDHHEPNAHRPRGSSPSAITLRIDDFLVKTLRDNDPQRVIDLYLEIGLIRRRPSPRHLNERLAPDPTQGYLFGQTHKAFERCLQIGKATCEFANARVHYADARQLLKSFWTVSSLLTRIQQWLHLVNHGNAPAAVKQATVALYYDLAQHQTGDLKHLLNDMQDPSALAQDVKIERQLEHIADAHVKSVLTRYLQEQLALFPRAEWVLRVTEVFRDLVTSNTARRLADTGSGDPLVYADVINQNKQRMHATLLQAAPGLQLHRGHVGLALEAELADRLDQAKRAYDVVMDAYLLGRVFRSFANGLEQSRNVIVYAGETHARNYRTILQNQLGFQLVRQTTSRTQCINVQDFDQPFFT